MSRERAKAENFLRHLEPLQGALEAYCRRMVHDPGDVLDVLQSAVAKAYRDFHRYVEGTNFRAWIFRYLNLEIFNRNRQYQRARSAPLPPDLLVEETWQMVVDEPLFEQLLENPEIVLERCEDAVAEAVRELAPLEQAVLLLRAIGEFKYREMAEILDIPIGTVMSCLARSRLRLRHRLLDYCRERGFLKH